MILVIYYLLRNTNFKTYIQNNPDRNLAFCVVIFNDLVTIQQTFFDYFKNNLYTNSEYNALIRKPIRNINNDIWTKEAIIPQNEYSDLNAQKQYWKYYG